MSIGVARGVVSRIRDSRDHLVIQVQAASDPRAAAEALERARGDIQDLDGGWRSMPNLTPRDRNNPKHVSEVLPAGTGPFVWVDCGFTPYRLCRTIPDLVARRLVEAGVADAVIAAPRPYGQSVFSLQGQFRTVTLCLFPPPPRSYREPSELPPGWLEEASAWVTGGGRGLGPGDELWAELGGIQFTVAAAEVLGMLEQCRDARASTVMLIAEADARIRMAKGSFRSIEPSLELAAGGSGASDDELPALVAELRDIAARLVPQLAYGFISVEPTFEFSSLHETDWHREHDGGPPQFMGRLCDEYVFDAFPYQVLGPGHLRRLGGTPAGARPLAGGRVELSIGDLSAWLLDPWLPGPWPDPEPWWADPQPWQGASGRRRDPRIQEKARQLLSPCLLKSDEAFRLVKARNARTRTATERAS